MKRLCNTHSGSCRWAAFGSWIMDRRESGTVAGRMQSETAAVVLEATTLQYVNCDSLAEEPFAIVEEISEHKKITPENTDKTIRRARNSYTQLVALLCIIKQTQFIRHSDRMQ